jgi:hypothetical protein
MKLSKDHMRRWNKTVNDLIDERDRLEGQYQEVLQEMECREMARLQRVYAALPEEDRYEVGDRVFVDYSGTENGISREGTVTEVEVMLPTSDDDFYAPDWCVFDEDDSSSRKEGSVWVLVGLDPTPKGNKRSSRFCVAGDGVDWSAPVKKIS